MSDEPFDTPIIPPPSGNPVSTALLLPGGGFGERLRLALQVLDAVHGDGQLPLVPVVPTRTMRHDAEYQSEFNTVTGRWDPRRLGVSRATRRLELGLYHEVGHLLDEQIFGDGRMMGSTDPVHPELSQWRVQVARSRAFANLVHMLRSGRGEFEDESDSLFRSGLDSRQSETVRYLLQPEELFARSYAQYVAVRSQDGTLVEQVIAEREIVRGQPFFAVQWEQSDFEPIADAFDLVFQRRGWR
jgi:hypothetical protein